VPLLVVLFFIFVGERNLHTYGVEVVLLEIHDVDIEIVGVVSHGGIRLDQVSSESSTLSLVVKQDMFPPSSVFNLNLYSKFFHLLSKFNFIKHMGRRHLDVNI